MLSDKAKAVADKIRSLDADDLKALADTIRDEVGHVSDAVSKAAKTAEVRVRKFADEAEDTADRLGREARQTVEDHPIPTALVALGAGFLLGVLIGSSRR